MKSKATKNEKKMKKIKELKIENERNMKIKKKQE